MQGNLKLAENVKIPIMDYDAVEVQDWSFHDPANIGERTMATFKCGMGQVCNILGIRTCE